MVSAATRISSKGSPVSESSIPEQEESLLQHVRTHLAETLKNPAPVLAPTDYGKQLIELRDEISEARLEDVPALVAQMERVSGVAARRAEVQTPPVDHQAPYFARLRLRENDRERDVLLGRTTYIDSRSGIRIVDWRHAPVSQLYYRYPEGSQYDETFGDREVQGEVLVRRTVTIVEGDLLRIQAPQGIFVKRQSAGEAQWQRLDHRTIELGGGQGQAVRPGSMTRGSLGIGSDGQQRNDRHLPEIAALLDARQFELISAADTGVVVIQGGAGSGKTTIGLHRIAYLAFHNPKRFSPDKVLIITYGIALGAYISEVLPALGVPGVRVESFAKWAETQRKIAIPWLSIGYDENTPPVVTRLKKHPALLRLFTRRAHELIETTRSVRGSRAIVSLWAEVLTDLPALQQAMTSYGAGALHVHELTLAHRWCTEHCATILENDPRDGYLASEDDTSDDGVDEDRKRGIDGRGIHEEEGFGLDREDDALFLRLHQLLVGPLRKARQNLVYEHVFVDEAQDLSPVELAVLFGTVSSGRSVTLAGDTAQRLYFDNGFRDWRTTLDELGLSATDIEPLRIAYRSTKEVLEVARAILGPLADPEPPLATRSGAPVEVHTFSQTGAAVAFLAEALRALLQREPRATVGVLSRFAEQADAYFEGLIRSEIPNVRRVRAQDFSFRPGIDVTEVHQVKGLEFDYVILVDVNEPVFPANDEARHLLHIAATRAAHQLWFLVTGKPSPLLPITLL